MIEWNFDLEKAPLHWPLLLWIDGYGPTVGRHAGGGEFIEFDGDCEFAAPDAWAKVQKPQQPKTRE